MLFMYRHGNIQVLGVLNGGAVGSSRLSLGEGGSGGMGNVSPCSPGNGTSLRSGGGSWESSSFPGLAGRQ